MSGRKQRHDFTETNYTQCHLSSHKALLSTTVSPHSYTKKQANLCILPGHRQRYLSVFLLDLEEMFHLVHFNPSEGLCDLWNNFAGRCGTNLTKGLALQVVGLDALSEYLLLLPAYLLQGLSRYLSVRLIRTFLRTLWVLRNHIL